MWKFPLKMNVIGVTWNSMSFSQIDIEKNVEIPVGNHCGAFGVTRKYDVHKGVDLYCPENTEVYAVEDGIIVQKRPFTGSKVGSPWWNDTDAVSIECESGIVVYGEIEIDTKFKEGDVVKSGEKIGRVKAVLKEDKGRPMSMLHIALHHHGVLSNGNWDIGKPQPIGLLDPTNKLISTIDDLKRRK